VHEGQAPIGVVLVEQAREGVTQLAGQPGKHAGDRHRVMVRPW
jgi:hypothetical protein